MSDSFLSACAARATALGDTMPTHLEATSTTGISQLTSEPQRAHALELTLIGHLLASRSWQDVVHKRDFERVWREKIVPIAASRVTSWKVGMSAQIVGLKSASGTAFNDLVGRVAGEVPSHLASDGEWLTLLVAGPDGSGLANLRIQPANLKAPTRSAAVIFVPAASNAAVKFCAID